MTRTDDIADLTRGLAGPWKVHREATGILKFTCQVCRYVAVILSGTRKAPKSVAEEFNKLAHPCNPSRLLPSTDQGFVTIRRKRYGVEQ